MAKIDENQEAVAKIRMAVDNYDKAIQEQQPERHELPNPSELSCFNSGQRLWAFGSLESVTTAKVLEQTAFTRHPDSLFRHLDSRLKAFLRTHVSADCVSDEAALNVRNK
jgi:hypothetical protein